MFMLPYVSQPPALKPTPHCDWSPRARCSGPNRTRITPAAWPWNSAAAVFCEARIRNRQHTLDVVTRSNTQSMTQNAGLMTTVLWNSLFPLLRRRKLSSKQFCRTAEPGGISRRSVGRNSASKRVPHHIRASFGMAKCNISPSQKGAYRPMRRVDSTRYDAPVLMDTRNFRSTRLTGIHCRRNISLAAQVFVRGMAIRFLFGGLLAGALVPPAVDTG